MARAARARAPSAARWRSSIGWHLLDSGALYRLVALAGRLAGTAARGPRRPRPPGHAPCRCTSAAPRTAPSRCAWTARTSRPRSAPKPPAQGASRVAAWPAGARGAPGAPARLRRHPRVWSPTDAIWAPWSSPGPHLKIFLTATPEERALRRHKQLKDKGSDVSLPALSREIAERDSRDQTRAVAPLKPAPDACVIDSTGMPVEEVVGQGAGVGSRSRLVARVAARRDTHGRFAGWRTQDAGARYFFLDLKDEGPVQARPGACEVKV